MEEIIRRLRSRDSRSMRALKESLPVKGIHEEDEITDEEFIGDEENPEDEEIPTDDTDLDMSDEAGEEEELNPDNSEDPSEDPSEEESLNPLDNPYAVNYKIGQQVMLVYSNGSKTKLSGIIDGYDKEGFYRIKWSNGKTTSGLTDIALSDMVEDTYENKCVCGSTDFVNEGAKTVCDKCGRAITDRTQKRLSEEYGIWSDDISDRTTKTAPTLDKAIEKAIYYAMRAGGYRYYVVDRGEEFFSVTATYRRGNCTLETSRGDFSFRGTSDSKVPADVMSKILSESSDPLTIADKMRPKGKRLIRSQAHEVSTSIPECDTPKRTIADSIRAAFKKPIRENEEDLDIFDRLRNSLENEFWTRPSEMIADIEELGYDVLDSNAEYIVVAIEDEEGEDHQIQIPVGGTSRTMTLDFQRANML